MCKCLLVQVHKAKSPHTLLTTEGLRLCIVFSEDGGRRGGVSDFLPPSPTHGTRTQKGFFQRGNCCGNWRSLSGKDRSQVSNVVFSLQLENYVTGNCLARNNQNAPSCVMCALQILCRVHCMHYSPVVLWNEIIRVIVWHP